MELVKVIIVVFCIIMLAFVIPGITIWKHIKYKREIARLTKKIREGGSTYAIPHSVPEMTRESLAEAIKNIQPITEFNKIDTIVFNHIPGDMETRVAQNYISSKFPIKIEVNKYLPNNLVGLKSENDFALMNLDTGKIVTLNEIQKRKEFKPFKL
jgi:hypothetical protein